MSGDWMLAQGTVEFRPDERDHANGRDRTPTRCHWCGDPVVAEKRYREAREDES